MPQRSWRLRPPPDPGQRPRLRELVLGAASTVEVYEENDGGREEGDWTPGVGFIKS